MFALFCTILPSDLINPCEIHDHFTRQQLVTNYLYRNFKQTVINTALLFLPYVLGIDLDSLIREASSINSFKILFKRSSGM